MNNTEQHLVCTIGPASKDLATQKEMLQNGMTMARLNMSHGTHSEHATYIKNLRTVKTDLPIIVDLSGPRMTTNDGHSFDPSQSAFTTKDQHDLSFAVNEGVDWVVLSFVRSADDILELRQAMRKLGRTLLVMAKIEHADGVKNIIDIMAASDAIMIGRGDLGDQIGLKNIGRTTLQLTRAGIKSQTPVIVATEIMESMHTNDQPTRAEATDAWLHGYSGATGIMLSGESAIGNHPTKAVQWASDIFSQGKSDRKEIPNLASTEL